MKYLLIVLISLIFVSGCNSKTEKPVTSHPPSMNQIQTNDHWVGTKVPSNKIQVLNGDLIQYEGNGRVTTVQLYLIETPDMKQKKPFAEAALAVTQKMIENSKYVFIEIGAGEKHGSNFKAYVYADGKSVQEELLRKGLARLIEPKKVVKHIGKYRGLQEEAKKKEIGIWADAE